MFRLYGLAEKGADILCALHSMGADRCNDNMTDCKDGCRCQGYYDGLPQESQFDISDELEKGKVFPYELFISLIGYLIFIRLCRLAPFHYINMS